MNAHEQAAAGHEDNKLDLTSVIGDPIEHRQLRLECIRLAFDKTSNAMTLGDRLWYARRIARFVIEGDTPNLRKAQTAEPTNA